MSSDLRGLLVALGAIALASAYAGSRWGIFGLLAALAVGAVPLFVLAFSRPRQGLEPDPSADSQLIGSVPNLPIAEMVIDELGQQGIPAFYKVRGVGYFARTSVTTPADACDIYVAERDAQTARSLFPDAHAKAARGVNAGVQASEHADP